MASCYLGLTNTHRPQYAARGIPSPYSTGRSFLADLVRNQLQLCRPFGAWNDGTVHSEARWAAGCMPEREDTYFLCSVGVVKVILDATKRVTEYVTSLDAGYRCTDLRTVAKQLKRASDIVSKGGWSFVAMLSPPFLASGNLTLSAGAEDERSHILRHAA